MSSSLSTMLRQTPPHAVGCSCVMTLMVIPSRRHVQVRHEVLPFFNEQHPTFGSSFCLLSSSFAT
jgi:hypothetical protein